MGLQPRAHQLMRRARAGARLGDRGERGRARGRHGAQQRRLRLRRLLHIDRGGPGRSSGRAPALGPLATPLAHARTAHAVVLRGSLPPPACRAGSARSASAVFALGPASKQTRWHDSQGVQRIVCSALHAHWPHAPERAASKGRAVLGLHVAHLALLLICSAQCLSRWRVRFSLPTACRPVCRRGPGGRRAAVRVPGPAARGRAAALGIRRDGRHWRYEVPLC